MLRHAEAADGRPDETRPLTERGLADARNVGLALHQLGVRIDTCLSSPKRRAQETARLACAPAGVEVTLEPALAGGDYDAERIATGLGETLIVAHNPEISGAVRQLTGARVQLRPGGIAAIEQGELVVLMTPTEIGRVAAAREALV